MISNRHPTYIVIKNMIETNPNFAYEMAKLINNTVVDFIDKVYGSDDFQGQEALKIAKFLEIGSKYIFLT